MDAFCFDRLLPLFEKCRFRRGDLVLSEGAEALALHVLYAGCADVVVHGNTVSTIGAKNVVGERAICHLGSTAPLCSASVVVSTTVLVSVTLRRQKLIDMFQGDPHVYKQFEALFDYQKEARGEYSLNNIALFRSADANFCKQLEFSLKHLKLESGEVLVQQGETSSDGYLLCSGTVSVKNSKESTFVTVDNMKQAVILGEYNLVGLKSEAPSTILATTDCLVHVIYQECLRQALEEFPGESWIFRKLVESRFDKTLVSPQKSIHQRTMELMGWDQPNDPVTGGDSSDSDASDCSNTAPEAPVAKCGSKTEPITPYRKDHWTPAPVTPARRIERRAGAMVVNNERLIVPHDLRLVYDFRTCHWDLLRKLEARMNLRMYIPHCVLMRQGEDLADVFILQRGICRVEIFGAEIESLEGPRAVGGVMSLLVSKALTTVIASETCFVATISKNHVAAMLDEFPEDRRNLFAAASNGLDSLCDAFHDHYSGKDEMQRSLAALPNLSDSSYEFLSHLATIVEPRLLLPGQVIIQGIWLEGEPKLYILFEGYCHMLNEGMVIGTISPNMIFGELDVYGIVDCLGDGAQVKTVELCQVGTVGRNQLYKALQNFPDERERFEQLVHNRLEESVYSRITHQVGFNAMPSHFLHKICTLLERRLYFEDTQIIREGEIGDSMLIVNRGKVELTFGGITVGMIWAGKAFGVCQLLGIHHEYHASLRAKRTSQVLILSRRALNTLAVGTHERPWIASLESHAHVIHRSEVEAFQRKLREHRQMVRAGISGDSADGDASFLHFVLLAWSRCVRTEREVHATVARGSVLPRASLLPRGSAIAHPRASTFSKGQCARGSLAAGGDAQDYMQKAPPIRFSRRLRRVELEVTGEGVISTDVWHHWSQSGRLDTWSGMAAPKWIAAVREEIPNQLMSLKKAARGEVSRLPGLLAC